MNRRGLRISRSWLTSTRSMKVPSIGCKEYPQSRIHINGFLVDFDEGIAESIDMGNGRNVVHEVLYTHDPANAFEVEATLQVGTIYRYRTDRIHIVVAVYVAQVPKSTEFSAVSWGWPRNRRLRNPSSPHSAPEGWVIWQVPLRRPTATSHTKRRPCRGSLSSRIPSVSRLWEPGRSEWQRIGRSHRTQTRETDRRGDPLRTMTADRRPQVRAQVRTYRVGHADAAFLVAPSDDFLAQPRFLDQFISQNGLAACDEIPPFGKRW